MIVQARRMLRRPALVQWALLVFLLLLSAAAFLLATRRAEQAARNDIRTAAAETLQLQAETIESQLDKYRFLPAIVARRPEIISLVAASPLLPQPAGLRQVLDDATYLSGSLDVAVADWDGRILASVNGLVTERVAENPLLSLPARQGRLGRAAVSITENRRAYAFASTVRRDGRPAGSVIVLAPIEEVERAWTLSGKPVFATDTRLQVVARDLQALEFTDSDSLGEIAGMAVGSIVRQGESEYALFSRPINVVGWRLHVLENLAPVENAWRQAALVSLLGSALLVVAVMGLTNRWLRRLRSDRLDRANAIRLERTVRERTRDLSLANQQLKKTQAELVQAGKLAGLGQMSAALSHEFNQPLAAIRSYADNAAQYLKRERVNEASENITRIAALTARMARISKDLQNFARRPQERSEAVVLQDIIASSLELIEARLVESGVGVSLDLPSAPLVVRGGVNRLQQVVVNLAINAIDAMSATAKNGNGEVAKKGERTRSRKQPAAGHAAGVIEMKGWQEGDRVWLVMRDHGPGFSEEVAASMFDPFFTTKGVNEGLGLGLSISYNIVRDFGGRLSAGNHPDGGAEFTLELEAWRETTGAGTAAGTALPTKRKSRARVA